MLIIAKDSKEIPTQETLSQQSTTIDKPDQKTLTEEDHSEKLDKQKIEQDRINKLLHKSLQSSKKHHYLKLKHSTSFTEAWSNWQEYSSNLGDHTMDVVGMLFLVIRHFDKASVNNEIDMIKAWKLWCEAIMLYTNNYQYMSSEPNIITKLTMIGMITLSVNKWYKFNTIHHSRRSLISIYDLIVPASMYQEFAKKWIVKIDKRSINMDVEDILEYINFGQIAYALKLCLEKSNKYQGNGKVFDKLYARLISLIVK